MGVKLMPGDRHEYDANLKRIRAQLDEETFQACWEAGHTMSLEEMLDLAGA
jgi:hypothetical protein